MRGSHNILSYTTCGRDLHQQYRVKKKSFLVDDGSLLSESSGGFAVPASPPPLVDRSNLAKGQLRRLGKNNPALLKMYHILSLSTFLPLGGCVWS
jgi:hypothetical protein